MVGVDSGRLSTILAVLEARCGIPFTGLDVFLNVAGGMRVSEPAADLAVAGALLSAREDVAIPPEMVLFGEISLSGALRPVGQTENRLKEASKLGFSQATLPAGSKTRRRRGHDGAADARPDGLRRAKCSGQDKPRGSRRMEGFTLIDAIVAAVIVLSAILAYSRGLVREAMAIAGWVGAAVAGLHLRAAGRAAGARNCRWWAISCRTAASVSIIASFAAVFALGLVVMSLFTPLFSSAVQRSVLGGLDQALGFLFGVVRGVLLVAVAFIVYDRAVAADTIADGRQLALGQGLRLVPGQPERDDPRGCAGLDRRPL